MDKRIQYTESGIDLIGDIRADTLTDTSGAPYAKESQVAEASAKADQAVATATESSETVRNLLTAEAALTGPYIQLRSARQGDKITIHVAGKAGTHIQPKIFWGKNIWNVAGMDVSGGYAGHTACAYGPLVVPFSQYLYLTIPTGWRVYIRETDAYAYMSSEGNLIQETSYTESGPVILNASTVGKSIRMLLCKVVSDEEVLPTASELAALVATTQLEYGESATVHADYVAPTILEEYTYSAAEPTKDYEAEIVSTVGNLGVVPLADSGAECDYESSYVSYLTTDLADTLIEESLRNDSQDEKIGVMQADIEALKSLTGNEVYAIQFKGSQTEGTRLLSSVGKTFDLATQTNDFENDALFREIYDTEELVLDADGNQIYDEDGVTPLVAYFVHFPNFYVRATSVTDGDGDQVDTYYISPTARSGYSPMFVKSDGTAAAGCLIGKYPNTRAYGAKYYGEETSSLANAPCGPFRDKMPFTALGFGDMIQRAFYLKDSALGITAPKQWNPTLPLKAWNMIQYLYMVVVGSRNSQSLFPGINGDGGFNAFADAHKSLQPTEAANTVVIPSTNYIVTNSSVGDEITLRLGDGSTDASRRRVAITAMETDVPSSGYTTIAFEGDAVDYATATTLYVYLTWAHRAGSTDSIVWNFGNVATDGRHSFKIFGLEDFYGQNWNILSGAAIYQTYDATAGKGVNTVYAAASDDVITSSYGAFESTGLEMATTGLQYVKELTSAGGFLVTAATGASSTTYYSDYYWTDSRTAEGSTAWREFFAGGSCSSGADDGLFCLYCCNGWGSTHWSCGSRSFLLV